MNQNQLPELRLTLLDIMCAVHKMCIENNLRYYLVYGSALGAVRHKGFIPWDTDIDIAMPRDDYNRFFEICDKKIDKGFRSISYHNTEKFYLPHGLVVKNDTLIHWNSDYYKENKVDMPVYIDIFPLDEVPIEEKLQKKQQRVIYKKMRLLSRRNCIIYTRNNVFQKALKYAIRLVLNIQPDESFNKEFDSELSRYNKGESTIWCSMTSPYGYANESMESTVYGTPQLYQFEDYKFFGPENIDIYLTRIYGNYMELPPVEKRTEHVDYVGYIDT